MPYKLLATLNTKYYLYTVLSSTDARAKLSMQSAVAKARGHQAQTRYPQPEGTLGETMTKGQQDLGDESLFGKFSVADE